MEMGLETVVVCFSLLVWVSRSVSVDMVLETVKPIYSTNTPEQLNLNPKPKTL